MWGMWQWTTWLCTSTGLRHAVPLSGSVSRVSQPLSTTDTTIEDEADTHASRALLGKHMHVTWYPRPHYDHQNRTKRTEHQYRSQKNGVVH